jgi:hypothetical protein
MTTASRWLHWTPSQPEIIETPPKVEPSKPTKPSFDGFDGSSSEPSPIIRAPKSTDSPGQAERVKIPGTCPYTLPEGVHLTRYTPKHRRVAVTVCSMVEDVPKFIGHALHELEARLRSPIQIKAGDSVFELLSKLADCGLELRLEWAPEARIIGESPETEPSKPTKLPEPPELTVPTVCEPREDIQP